MALTGRGIFIIEFAPQARASRSDATATLRLYEPRVIHHRRAKTINGCFSLGRRETWLSTELYKRGGDATLRQPQEEVDMPRTLLVLTFALSVATPLPLVFQDATSAVAAECSGENCPPPAGQGGGHDCEHEKKDETVS
jgi:hypothetical protein